MSTFQAKKYWPYIAMIVVGITYCVGFRLSLASLQILPSDPWTIAKLFSAGLLLDLSLWLFATTLLLYRGTRFVGLGLALLFMLLNISNLISSYHFKAGLVNFRFVIDYLNELGPLTRTGGLLSGLPNIILLLILPLVFWVALFRFRENWSFTPKVLAAAALASLLGGLYILPEYKNILGNNVLYRMAWSEYEAYQQIREYSGFAEALDANQSHFPDQQHFKNMGYSFPLARYPLYKVPGRTRKKPGRKPNIVIIMMESVAAKDTGFRKYNKLIGKDVTPFLTSLMPRSLVVPFFFSNSDYTAGAEVAAFCSYHDSLRYSTGTGSILRNYPHTSLQCLPKILRDVGYHTMFFHSYTATFDNKDVFFPVNGVNEVIDKDNEVFRGLKQTFWGIADIEMFKYGPKHLDKQKEPFMAIFLTVTNHPPFILHDKNDRNNFGEEGKYGDYLNTVNLTDRSIAEFFERARKMSWYENTIFLITSDNGIILYPERYKPVEWVTTFKMWHLVPFLLFSPDKRWGFAGKELNVPAASHVDITPTLLDLLDIHIPNAFVGESLFARKRRDYTFIYDWFYRYYRLSWPYLYHSFDRTVYDLQKEALVENPSIVSHENWVEQSRNFFNLLTYRNRVWPVTAE